MYRIGFNILDYGDTLNISILKSHIEIIGQEHGGLQ